MSMTVKIAVAGAALSVAMCGFAKNGTWFGTTDGDPTKAENWSTGELCGSLDDINNRDAATFRGSVENSTLIPSQEWIVGTMTFGDYNGKYTNWKIGSGDPDGVRIRLAGIGSGYIDFNHAAGVTDFTVDLAGPFVVSNNMQFSCYSTEPSNAFKVGRIIGRGEMQLKGNGNRGVVYGPLSDGEGGTMGITKLHGGTWTVKGQNSFSGIVTITMGTIIAGGDVGKAGTVGPFGCNTYYTSGLGVRVGNPNPTSTDFSALLLGYNDDGTPVTFARETTSQQNNTLTKTTPVNQKAHFGGANTNGVTKFTATVRSYRPCVLKCAAGGTVDFVGAFSANNKTVEIGTEDFTGTVRLENNGSGFATDGGVTCEYGTLDMCTELKAATTVRSGATLTSSSSAKGKVTGALTVEDGGILAGSEGGVLQINGDLSLAQGAVLSFPVAARESALVKVTSAVSLDGIKVRLTGAETPVQGKFALLTADGGLSDADKADVSEMPKYYSLVAKDNTLYAKYNKGLVVSVR